MPNHSSIINKANDVRELRNKSRSKPKSNNNNNNNSKKKNDCDNIQVAVRIRPFLSFESGNRCCVKIPPGSEGGIELDHNTNSSSSDVPPHKFTFDSTFDSDSTQDEVFERVTRPLIKSCLEGHNATILAYGQTGSGKTHTILGNTSGDGKDAGIIPRAFDAIFDQLDPENGGDAKLQFLEVYGEDIRDLLSTKLTGPDSSSSLAIRDGDKNSEPIVIGATHKSVRNSKEALLCLSKGMLRRVVRSTDMNSESSRSHAIMSLIINGGRNRFNFVDLAGSERIKRTNVCGQGLKEGININKGLLVLGNVISALASTKKQKSHIPYRDSKLTRLLRGSLGGHHKTLMIACVSPSSSNTEETLNTLRYANRAKQITNKAALSKFISPPEEIAELKLQLSLIAIAFMNLLFQNNHPSDDNDETFYSLLEKLSKNQQVVTAKLKQSMDQFVNQHETTTTNTTTIQSSLNPLDEEPSELQTSREDLEKLKQQNESLQTQLNEYKEQVVEQLRLELEQSKQNNEAAQEEILWLRDEISLLKKNTDADETSSTSALSDDPQDCEESDDKHNLISKDTFESIINANKSQLDKLRLEIKDREDERDKIAMTLYRFKSEKQCMIYVKHALLETIETNQAAASKKKKELDIIRNIGPPRRLNLIRRWGRKEKKKEQVAKNTSESMKSFYSEKLLNIEKQIQDRDRALRVNDEDLNERMTESKVLISMEQKLQDELNTLTFQIENFHAEQKAVNAPNQSLESLREKRQNLRSELVRIDSEAMQMTESVLSIKKDQVSLRDSMNELKEQHIQFAESVGLPSIYNTHDSDDVDSVSEISVYSFDSSGAHNMFSTHAEYEEAVKKLENELIGHETEKNDASDELTKLLTDLEAIDEMKSSLIEKLAAKEKNLGSLKDNEQILIANSLKQEGELAKLIPVTS